MEPWGGVVGQASSPAADVHVGLFVLEYRRFCCAKGGFWRTRAQSKTRPVAYASACHGQLQFAVPQSQAPAAELSAEADSGTLRRAPHGSSSLFVGRRPILTGVDACPTISTALPARAVIRWLHADHTRSRPCEAGVRRSFPASNHRQPTSEE